MRRHSPYLIALPGRKTGENRTHLFFQDMASERPKRVPKSQIAELVVDGADGSVTITIPRWLAEELDLT